MSEAIKIYQEILSGNRKNFPDFFSNQIILLATNPQHRLLDIL